MKVYNGHLQGRMTLTPSCCLKSVAAEIRTPNLPLAGRTTITDYVIAAATTTGIGHISIRKAHLNLLLSQANTLSLSF